MKIKSAVSICLRNERLQLLDETIGETGEVRQWISDGAAMYLMSAEPGPLSINYGGNTYIPYVGGGKLVYINREYMTPFQDKREGLSLVIRETESGTPYLVVMFGLLTIGIVMPFDPCSLGLIAGHLDELATMTRWNAKEREVGEEAQ